MRILFLVFILFSKTLCAQLKTGVYGGLAFEMGNKQRRVGLVVGSFVAYQHLQVNGKVGGYYNFKSIGAGQRSWEAILGLGVVGTYGVLDSTKIMFNTLLDNNTFRKHSLGYAYTYYLDSQHTSQATGTFMVAIDKFQILTENDLFGGKSGLADRNRTGAFSLNYQYDNFQFSWKHIFWTGDYSKGNKVIHSSYPSRKGYYDDEHGLYTSCSAGISALEVKYKLPYQQVVSVSLGVDAEYIRHGFQNWLMHDAWYIPDGLYRNGNLHIPMLDSNGGQYLFNKGQKVKPASIYFSLGLNRELFY